MNNYHPEEIEKKWLKAWEPPSSLDKLGTTASQGKPKYYALVEFPYPSGSGLHLGHAFANTVPDVFARYKRMKGFNVLFPMGWDAFGLPTENYAIKTGIHPAKATKENTARFKEQNKRLGMSFDWDREIDTTDPDYYRWTQWIFVQLFKHGLAYKAETPVGWCPRCKIVLANEEIVGGKCERCGETAEHKMQSQWLLRITKYADRLADELDLVDYPDYVKASQRSWIGRSEGAEIKFKISGSPRKPRAESRGGVAELSSDSSEVEFVSVFTTRPDTLFGVTAAVVAPEHELAAELLASVIPAPVCHPRAGGDPGHGVICMDPLIKSEDDKGLSEDDRKGEGIGGDDYAAEIRAYVEQSKRKSELERTSLAKEKTGVFTGLYCINPVNNKSVPVWIGDYVVAGYGGGAVMVVPAHDKRDFDFAKKYGLPVEEVVREIGDLGNRPRGSAIYEGYGKLINSGAWNGWETPKDMEKIIKWLEEKGIGKKTVNYHLRDWVFSRQHYWGEPIPMIFCSKCAKNNLSSSSSTGGSIKINLDSPIESENDRGRFGDDKDFPCHLPGNMPGWFPVNERDLPVKLPEVEKYQPTETGESPLANIKSWVETKCPNCGSPAKRETDTMPNWAGSSWYYLAYLVKDKLGIKNSKLKIKNSQNIFSQNKNILRRWLPVDLYFGGAEHTTLHLLYSRFWHKFLNDIGLVPGKEPYAARYQHGVILGEDGSRMSKSRGNVINPDDIVNKFGADTLRLYLCFMGPHDSTMPWSMQGVGGCYRFLSRVWRLFQGDKFVIPALNCHPRESGDPGHEVICMDPLIKPEDDIGRLGMADSSLRRLLHKTIKKVGDDIEHIKHNTAVAAMMEFVNAWERSDSRRCKANPRGGWTGLAIEDAGKFLRILAPFAPFMAEELWQNVRVANSFSPVIPAKAGIQAKQRLDPPVKPCLPAGRLEDDNEKNSIHAQPWPAYDEKLIQDEMATIVVQINGKTRGTIQLKIKNAKLKIEAEKVARADSKINQYLIGKTIKNTIFVAGRLINFVVG